MSLQLTIVVIFIALIQLVQGYLIYRLARRVYGKARDYDYTQTGIKASTSPPGLSGC